MGIDLENAKREFIKYVEKFDLKEEHIENKKTHSLRVMKISEEIATKLKLTQEEVELAALIGLLHDIARFQQYTQFKTFRDLDSFDHGDYALEILEKDMRKYIKTSEYDKLIQIAIKNHNKYKIEEGLSEKELLFAKIIRDADKLDIFYEAVTMFWNGLENQIGKTKISQNVEKEFKENKQIKRKKNNNKEPNINEVINVISFIFDINFRETFKIIKERNYINEILERFKFSKVNEGKINEIKTIASNFINKNS